MTISPGDNVGPYRIIEPLGQGGMAAVFKAYHPALDRYVAIKVLHPAFKEDPNFLARFHREARIVAKLDHPNIIPIYDFAEHEGTPYLVMRYVEGKTLKAILRDGALPLARVLSIARPVTDALAYAHAQRVLHRDIKPSNVIRANDEHIYLSDFGLARMAQTGESTLSRDMLIGTPQYISPEQGGGKPVDERSDIYSFGVVLFEMLTGRVPFSADTPYAVIHDHIYTALPLPTSINPNLSKDVERVLLKALAKDPKARHPSVSELMTALDQAASSPVPALSTTTMLPVSSGAGSAAPPAAAGAAPAIPAPKTPAQARAAAPEAAHRASRTPCVVVAIVALIALFACAAVASGQREAIQRAVKALQAPAAQAEAVRLAREKVNANPNDPTARILLGDALANRKDVQLAFAEYDLAIKLDPNAVTAYVHAGDLAEKANDLERAAKYYQAGLKADPDSVELLLAEGDLLFKQKKYDAARTLYEQILKIDPGSAQTVWRMGDVDRVQGRLAEALREYTRALVIDPDLPEAHYGLGMLALGRGANEEARRQFQIVVNNPKAPAELKDQAAKQLRALGGR